MVPPSFETLPEELLNTIGELLEPVDLKPVVASSQYLQDTFTPLLCAIIELHDVHRALSCLNMLSRPVRLRSSRANSHSGQMGRAQFVHTLSLDFRSRPSTNAASDYHDLGDALISALATMSGLRHFKFNSPGHYSEFTFCTLFNKTALTLQSVDMILRTALPGTENLRWMLQTNLLSGSLPPKTSFYMKSPICPKLSCVKLDLRDVDSLPLFVYLQRLLMTHSTQLRSLSLMLPLGPGSPTSTLVLLDPASSRPLLQALGIDLSVLLSGSLPKMPTVRSLAVYNHLPNGLDIGAYAVQLQLEDTIRALLATDYPRLQELCCTPSVLPTFLPPRSSGGGRPIRKVVLNSWSPQNYWTTLSAWPVVARALRSLPQSGGPVRDLTIEAGVFRWRDLVDDGGPYMASLNRLMLILYVAPEDVRFSLPAYSRHSLTL